MSGWRTLLRDAATCAAVAIVGFSACCATGQIVAQRVDIVARNNGGTINADNPDAKDSNEGVFPPESTDALDELAHAESMERQKEWNKSADFYQELLTSPKFSQRVVRWREDAEHRIYQYTSVGEQVTERLARWPREGLEIYRARYEAPADALLESAGNDQVALQEVFSRYFVTDAGKQAGIRLMDHALESGEFRAAAGIGERLLKWHPNILAERASIAYRTAIADHLAGDDSAARAMLDDLRKHDPQAKGTVRGKDVILADSLAEELAKPAPVSTGSTSDSYLTFGGDSSRDRILAVSGTPGAHLYSIPLTKPSHVAGPQAQALEARYKEEIRNGFTLGIMPVVDRGELFFQDGERVYGLNLESGVPLPGWQQSHGPEHDAAFTLPNVTGSPRSHQLTLTLTDRAVLAVMGEPDVELARAGLQDDSETRLVCLDRETGKQNWIVAPSDLKQPSLKTVQFSGSPLVVGDNVLLVAQSTRTPGSEASTVLCFDLANGTLRWKTDLGSANTMLAAYAGFAPNVMSPENESHLAYANGHVFVQTNRGVVAALDAFDGNIAWFDICPRGQNQQAMMNPAFNPMMFNGGGQFPQNQIRPWAFNPAMVSQGMVFALPSEGHHLLIYDAASGQEIKRIDLKELEQRVKSADVVDDDAFDVLVGVRGDTLALCGLKTLVLLNWKTYDPDHFKDDAILWDVGMPAPIRGRPLLTATSLYVPAEDKLYRIDLRTGLIKDVHPEYPRTWDDGEAPGNVLVTSDHTIIATTDSVDVYTDLGLAKKKLDREVAEAPNDPQPRLRYAEVMFAAGDYDTALAKLDGAITRLGGMDSMQPGPGRNRVFNDSLTFAQRLKAESAPAARARVEKFFDHAAAAALTPEQKVQYCMARARFDELKGEAPAALALYQQILSDPATRAVPMPDEASNAPASADVVTRGQIAEMIRNDPQIYDAVEKQAAEAMDKAQASKEPAALLEVSQAYPNSKVATPAALAAADAYEAAGDVHSARHVLSDIYFNHNEKSPEWQHILESMARTDPRSAPHLLALGVEQLHDPKLTQPMKLSDGSEIAAGTPFSAAVEKLRQIAAEPAGPQLPTFHLPLPQDYKTYPKPFLPTGPAIANVDRLIVPAVEFSRPDRIVTWSTAPALTIYPAGSDKPVASAAPFAAPPKGCAWMNQDLLAWNQTQLALLKGDKADLAWKLDLKQLAMIEVVAGDDATAEGAAPQPVLRANRFGMNPGGRAVIRNGVLVPLGVPAQVAPAKAAADGPEQIDRVLPVADRILFTTTTGRVACIDAATGNLAWQTRLSDRAVNRLLADESFSVVLAENEATVRLAVLDTHTGHVRGSKSYARDSNSFPQNLALSRDGTLVYTLPDRICLKDLYRPWDQRAIERIAAPGQASFAGMNGPEQLVISGNRILALTDSGNAEKPGEKFVRIYSLLTGEPILLNFTDGQQVEKALSIGSKSPDVVIRTAGPRAYLIAPDAAICYNLDSPDDHYQMFDQESDGMSARFSFIGRDYLVLLNGGAQPDPAANAPNAAAPEPLAVSPTYTMYAFSRLQNNGRESGRLDYSTTISDPAGITPAWQAIDGGLVYLSGDHTLHMLMGAGK